MAMEMSDINTEHFGPCSGSFVVTVENPSNTTNESKIMTRFLENQMKSAHEQEYCNVFDDDDEEDNDEDEQANDDQANDDQFDDGIDAERIGATIEKLVDAFDSTFDEDDTLTILEGDPTFDDEDEKDNKYADGESYLSDEDDELNLRYDGDSGSVNEHEDEKIGNVFDKAFEKSGFKKDDFLYQTGAAVDSLYRRLTSMPIGSKSHSCRSKEDHIVMKSKGKKKKSAENKSRRSKKHESFLKRQFQKYKMKGDDEELTRKSTGTTATIDENTVGIKNSFSTESDEFNLSNDMLVPDDIDDGTEYHADCGGCLQTEEFVTLCNMTTAITSDDEALDEAFKGVCKDQFERIQRQPTVKAFHEKFIASKRLSRWVNRAISCGADGIPQGSSTNLEDGTSSIIDRMVESADSGNGAKATARDKEVINMDPNRTKEHSGTKRIERKNNAFAPVDSFAAKYSSIEMMSCMGGRENESGTTPGQEALPKSKSLGCEKPNDVDPTALQAEAKTLANAVLYMKAPIQKIALSVSSSKILYGVKNLLHKTAGKKSSVSNLETKAMFSPGISDATNKVQASDLEEESPILRVIVEDKSLSFPYDELGRLHGRPSSEIIPGDKPNDPVSPDDLLEHEEAMLSTVKEAIENVELVLSKSKYGLHKKETDILLSPLRKSLARAKMIISASALGACAGKEYEEVSLNLDTRFETFEVELVTEPTKTCSVEIVEGDAVELAKQNDEETLATESSLSIPSEYQEPELEIAEEEHKAITGSSSFSVHSTTKKIEKTKKVKKQSFWKARRSKMDEPSQTVTPPICSSILLKKDDVEVTTHSQEAIAVEKVKDNSSSKAEKINKKPRWLSQRKKRKNGNLASVAHIQLSSSGNIHAVLPIVGTNYELESV
jgi:hypothetical protein